MWPNNHLLLARLVLLSIMVVLGATASAERLYTDSECGYTSYLNEGDRHLLVNNCFEVTIQDNLSKVEVTNLTTSSEKIMLEGFGLVEFDENHAELNQNPYSIVVSNASWQNDDKWHGSGQLVWHKIDGNFEYDISFRLVRSKVKWSLSLTNWSYSDDANYISLRTKISKKMDKINEEAYKIKDANDSTLAYLLFQNPVVDSTKYDSNIYYDSDSNIFLQSLGRGALIELDPTITTTPADGSVEEYGLGPSYVVDSTSTTFQVGERGDNDTIDTAVGGIPFCSTMSLTVTTQGYMRFGGYGFDPGRNSAGQFCINGVLCCSTADFSGGSCNERMYLQCTTATYGKFVNGSLVAGVIDGGKWCSDTWNCTPPGDMTIVEIPSSLRGFLKFDISSLAGKQITSANLYTYVESKTTDAGTPGGEGDIKLVHLEDDYGSLDTSDWSAAEKADINAAYIPLAFPTGNWATTNVKNALQTDIDDSQSYMALKLRHTLENDNGDQAYWTIGAQEGANDAYIEYETNASPDVNLTTIDGKNINAVGNVFRYQVDGDLTIDFNVIDLDGDYLNASIWYSTNQYGYENLIVSDLNLDVTVCDDTNFLDSTACSYDWNISAVLDGNYFIDINVTDGFNTATDSSDNNFMIDNAPNVTPTKIDGKNINAVGNVFRYTMDGNLTIDFNVQYLFSNYLTATLWYSPTQYGYANLIVQDLNMLSLDKNMISWWHFDDTNADNWTLDATDNSNDAQVNGASLVAGEYKKAFEFRSAENDYVRVPEDAATMRPEKFTFELWFYAYDDAFSITEYPRILSRANMDSLEIATRNDGNNSLYFYMRYLDIGWTKIDNIDANKWYHVALTYDKEHVKTYLNSIEKNSIAKISNANLAQDINIGCRGTIALECFDGMVDEPAFYNRALTAAEIEKHYSYGYATCTDDNFMGSTQCSYDLNIHKDLVSDGNYFIDISVTDGTYAGTDTSDANFQIANCPTPDTIVDANITYGPYVCNVPDQDLNGVLIVADDNITIDCGGMELVGNGLGVGIDLNIFSFTRMLNCYIHGYGIDILIPQH